jgi:RHS repeat-associated protein
LGLFYKDVETGLYYLNSRYYNPEIGRFINADGLIGETGDILGHNMYAYAKNNPVMMVDPSGYLSTWAKIGIGVGVGVIAVLAITAVVASGGTALVATSALSTAVKGALIGAATIGTGSAIYKIGSNALDGEEGNLFDGVGDVALEGASIGFGLGSLGGTAIGIYRGVKTLGKVNKMINYLENNNGTPPSGYKGGKVFRNNGSNNSEILPNAGYKEYDVNPRIPGQNRGSERLVGGDDGS